MDSKVIELKPIDTNGDNIKLGVGRHIIGRGPLLGCADKHISRNHAVIDIKPNGLVTLESTHANPCFYQKLGEKNAVPLPKFTEQRVHVGDRFSLMPFNFTYEIYSNSIIEEASGESDKTSVASFGDLALNEAETHFSDATRKRSDAKIMPPQSLKRNITSEKIAGRKRILPSWLKDLTSQNEEDAEKPSASSTKEAVKKLNEEESTEGSSKNYNRKKLSPRNSNKSEGEDENKRIPKGPRKVCRFGAKCYRKNPVHFQEESHPGDADYISPSTSDTDNPNKEDDDRPECDYGLSCYRKNPEHRKKFKHTRAVRAPPRAAAKKAKAKNKELQSDEEDSDSFIADDDSDNYNPDSDADTDEDIQSLLAEANEFKRNKKMLKPA